MPGGIIPSGLRIRQPVVQRRHRLPVPLSHLRGTFGPDFQIGALTHSGLGHAHGVVQIAAAHENLECEVVIFRIEWRNPTCDRLCARWLRRRSSIASLVLFIRHRANARSVALATRQTFRAVHEHQVCRTWQRLRPAGECPVMPADAGGQGNTLLRLIPGQPQQAARVLVCQIRPIACHRQAREKAQRFGIVDQRANAALRFRHGIVKQVAGLQCLQPCDEVAALFVERGGCGLRGKVGSRSGAVFAHAQCDLGSTRLPLRGTRHVLFSQALIELDSNRALVQATRLGGEHLQFGRGPAIVQRLLEQATQVKQHGGALGIVRLQRVCALLSDRDVKQQRFTVERLVVQRTHASNHGFGFRQAAGANVLCGQHAQELAIVRTHAQPGFQVGHRQRIDLAALQQARLKALAGEHQGERKPDQCTQGTDQPGWQQPFTRSQVSRPHRYVGRSRFALQLLSDQRVRCCLVRGRCAPGCH